MIRLTWLDSACASTATVPCYAYRIGDHFDRQTAARSALELPPADSRQAASSGYLRILRLRKIWSSHPAGTMDCVEGGAPRPTKRQSGLVPHGTAPAYSQKIVSRQCSDSDELPRPGERLRSSKRWFPDSQRHGPRLLYYFASCWLHDVLLLSQKTEPTSLGKSCMI